MKYFIRFFKRKQANLKAKDISYVYYYMNKNNQIDTRLLLFSWGDWTCLFWKKILESNLEQSCE